MTKWCFQYLPLQKQPGRRNPAKRVTKTEDVSVRHCLRAYAKSQRHEIVKDVCTERRSRRKNIRSSITRKMYKNSTGTDGHRTIGRPWHASHSNDSSPAEAICWFTRYRLPLPHPTMIRLPPPLTIRGFHLCLASFKPHLILAGRSLPRTGQP